MARRLARGVLVLAGCLGGARLGAQAASCTTGGLEVARLSFEGNAAFSSGVLADGIATTPSSWARRTFRFFGERRCIDRSKLPLDVLRLLVWYRNHGYLAATVDTAVTAAGRGAVDVRFSIREGLPVLVDSLTFAGLDAVPERVALLRGLATVAGRPFDKYANEATRATLTQRLHNGGYPDAEVFVGYDTHRSTRRAAVTFTAVTGPRVRLGAIVTDVRGLNGGPAAMDSAIVRRTSGLRSGDLYAQDDLERAKRALYQTEAFAQVSVTADSSASPTDSTVRLMLSATEGFRRTTRLGLGYGTLDCVRASADFTQNGVLGGAARLDVRSRVSKIGVGAPLTGFEAACPQAAADVYSKDLNYSVGATITQPPVFREYVPSFTIYSERRSEYNAYLRTAPVGGSVALTRQGSSGSRSIGYSMEFGRTEAQPALLCAVFNACVEADRDAFGRLQRLGVVSLSWSFDAADNPANPTRGSVLRVDLRTASSWTASDPNLRFTKVLVDGAKYWSLGGDVVLAARVRLGAVVGPSLSFTGDAGYVPPQERLFAGGPTTVRGFRQNELGPVVYIPAAYDTVTADGRPARLATAADTVYFHARSDSASQRIVPTGGNTLVVANLEARFPSPVWRDVLQFAAFADVGQVWNRGTPGAELSFGALQWTPGIGVRMRTLIGFVRLDWAYDPYQRPSGPAYYDASVASGGALFCVSPGNTLPVTLDGGVAKQAKGECPAWFQPPRPSTFLGRTNLSFSIGQAF
ncbi:MAG: BamA/TamA family outer membrane protein [Gemmatimonadetes bacterium]|nr:BamA/TamA family outer membrane protein [Gemmatimonadota bacterium]